jgi:hypothetical protein
MDSARTAFSTAIVAPTLLLVVLGAKTAQGQRYVSPDELINRQQAANNAEQSARDSMDAARIQASRMKKQWNSQRNKALKDFQLSIVPLSNEHLVLWKKVKITRGQCWQYAIKRDDAIAATAYYNPEVGYVVNGKFQANGFAWPTLDDALQNFFGKDGVWKLPDIPGWSKSHLLTSDEQLADMKRQALGQAKSQAITKIANATAEGIVDQVGPKIGEQIGNDLGINNPFQGRKPQVKAPAGKDAGKKPAPPLLQFKRLDEDRDKVRYGDSGGTFMIYKQKDGGGFEVLHLEAGDKGWQKYEEVFTTLEGAVQFASVNQLKLIPPAPNGRASQ